MNDEPRGRGDIHGPSDPVQVLPGALFTNLSNSWTTLGRPRPEEGYFAAPVIDSSSFNRAFFSSAVRSSFLMVMETVPA